MSDGVLPAIGVSGRAPPKRYSKALRVRDHHPPGAKGLETVEGIRFHLQAPYRAGLRGAKHAQRIPPPEPQGVAATPGYKRRPTDLIPPLDAMRLSAVLSVLLRTFEIREPEERLNELERILTSNSVDNVLRLPQRTG